jgi:hypothetical protein
MAPCRQAPQGKVDLLQLGLRGQTDRVQHRVVGVFRGLVGEAAFRRRCFAAQIGSYALGSRFEFLPAPQQTIADQGVLHDAP